MLATLFKKRFINICHELLIEGYQTMVRNKAYQIDMDEENLTAHLTSIIQILPKRNSIFNQIHIGWERRIYTYAHTHSTTKAKTASRIDLYFHQWHLRTEFVYSAEAKNLSAKAWTKSNTAKVNASQQKKEYITKGIDEFLQGNYPQGCMIAYVVQGDISTIVNDINQKIKKHPDYSEKIDELNITTSILGFNEIYDCKCITPSIPNGLLKHFFFDLT